MFAALSATKEWLDRRGADKRRIVAHAHAEFAVFAAQPESLDGALDDEDQPVRLERFFDEVVGTLLDRGDGRFDVTVTADDHHRQIGVTLADHIEQLEAVEPAALEPDVENDKARTARLDCSERPVAVAGTARVVAFVVQDARYQFADIVFIIDYQNIRRH